MRRRYYTWFRAKVAREKWQRYASVLTLLLLLLGFTVGGIFGFARSALADPHGVFYTAIGQQQLFFNVLAALDQADYVETQFDRQNLVQNRAATAAQPSFTEEVQALIEATNVSPQSSSSSGPGVSNLLTRLLTLEGNDLYTDHLVRQLGAETGRRVAANELLRVLCDFSLGYEDCKPFTPPAGSDPAGQAAYNKAFNEAKNRATVTDPLARAAVPFFGGVLGALSSGAPADGYYPGDAAYRQQAVLDPSIAGGPVAYSPDIAAWRTAIKGRTDKDVHNQLLAALLASAVRPYLPGFYAYPYDKFTASGGRLYVTPATAGQPVDAARYAAALTDAVIAPLEVDSIAAAAADRVALQLDLAEEQGVLAEQRIVPYSKDSDGQFQELAALIDLPAAVRLGEILSLPILLGQLDTSQQFSATAGANVPGTVELVNRPVVGSPGTVSGAQSPPAGENAPEGQVAGFYDVLSFIAPQLYQLLYQLPKSPTSPAANIVAGHLEEGALHALDRITNCEFSKKRTGRDGCPSINFPSTPSGGTPAPSSLPLSGGFFP